MAVWRHCSERTPTPETATGVRRKSRTNFQLARQRFFRQKLAVVGLVDRARLLFWSPSSRR